MEGRMARKRTRGRPRWRLMDWIMVDEYSKLKGEVPLYILTCPKAKVLRQEEQQHTKTYELKVKLTD